MTYNENSDTHSLCDLEQEIRGFPHLPHAAGSRSHLFPKHGLNGVNNHHIRLLPGDGALDRIEIRLAEKFQFPCHSSDPVGPQLDLL